LARDHVSKTSRRQYSCRRGSHGNGVKPSFSARCWHSRALRMPSSSGVTTSCRLCQ
jgi:hypothetical protein